MLDEITKSIKAELYSRATSPLMGSFIISWCIYNYKLIMLIASNEKVLEKYEIIDNTLYPQKCLISACSDNIFIQSSLIPIIATLIFIYAYPIFAEPIFKYARGKQKNIANLKKKIDGDALLTVQQGRNLREEIDKLEESSEKEILRKDREIERLKDQLQETPITQETNINDPSSILENDDNDIETLKRQLIRELAKQNDWVADSIVHKALRGPSIESDYIIDALITNNLINSKNYTHTNGKAYRLTSKGRAYAVENRLHV